jgi:hypothetical protein
MIHSFAAWRITPVARFQTAVAALRHCRWGEYNALRHDCQGFFDAMRQDVYL